MSAKRPVAKSRGRQAKSSSNTDGKRPRVKRPAKEQAGVQTMATATEVSISSCVGQIGETAGVIWHALDENGPLSITKLVKLTDAQRDTVLQAIGWLAREDKIEIEETARGRVLSLKRDE
jgi:hypothetical protein